MAIVKGTSSPTISSEWDRLHAKLIKIYNMASKTIHVEKLKINDRWLNTRCRDINNLTSTIVIMRDVRYVFKCITALKRSVRFCGQ